VVRREIRGGLDRLTRGLDALPAGRLRGFPGRGGRRAHGRVDVRVGRFAAWILLTAAAALLIAGLLVGGRGMGRRMSGAHSPD
jgi:hypothetical protein